MKRNMKNKLAVLSPMIFVIFSMFIDRFLLTVILLIAIYLYISICNLCRKHESLWLFVLVGIVTVPVNIEISIIICKYFSYFFGKAFVLNLIYFPLAYSVLLSFEEIFLGIIGRIIWKNQSPVWRNKERKEQE